MTSIKTAISLEESLFQRADQLAAELNISRSRLITLALEEFMQQYDNARLLESINNVYSTPPTEEEQLILQGMRQKQYELLINEPW